MFDVMKLATENGLRLKKSDGIYVLTRLKKIENL